jgi:hypothetical protein
LKHSGLLCADLDSLGARLREVRQKLVKSPHVWALFLSPSGDGLKAVFRVPADSSKHLASFRAVEKHVLELTGIAIDESCSDVARLCFMSYDPGIWLNPHAIPIEPLPLPEKPKPVRPNGDVPKVLERLQIAIEFAQTVGEMKRDDAARELWAQVYPELSSEKPGLWGKIVARAVAQVLRLSCIYALLDLSAKIRIEHLKAALALWRYCEDSARWIFESGTGNKNSDRILAALKVAGTEGLSKWQISNDLFKRHATKFEIDEALRLLHHLKLATCVTEKTGGRPAERWFYSECAGEESEESKENTQDTSLNSLSSQGSPEKSES